LNINHKFQIIFVCSGNSCRSPMAEALLRAKLPQHLQDKVVVRSAGTLGIDGMPATNYAIRVTEELGGRLAGHRSQGITLELIENADLILSMTHEHVDFLRQYYPAYRENFYLLKQFASKEPPEDPEIEDPIGANMAVYRVCAQTIAVELDRILPALVQLLETRAPA